MIEQAYADIPARCAPARAAQPQPEPTLHELYESYWRQGLTVFQWGGDGPEPPVYLIRLDHYRDLEGAFVKSARLRDGQARVIRFLVPALALMFSVAMALAVRLATVGGAQ